MPQCSKMFRDCDTFTVMPVLVTGIHDSGRCKQSVDARDKREHDGGQSIIAHWIANRTAMNMTRP